VWTNDEEVDVGAAVAQLIRESGWQSKKGEVDQFYIRVCPFCGNEKWKLHINENTGAWLCWICTERGKTPWALFQKAGLEYPGRKRRSPWSPVGEPLGRALEKRLPAGDLKAVPKKQ
jgi:ribosomal protein L37AE/L43A